MSRIVGDRLPADLFRRLSGANASSNDEKAIVVCTVDAKGYPHPAILSYFEVIARDERNVRFAMYGNSSSVANIRRSGNVTILIIDHRLALYVKGLARELNPQMSCSAQNSKLNLTVNQVLADEADEEFEPGAYITSGITYKRSANRAVAEELLRELLEG